MSLQVPEFPLPPVIAPLIRVEDEKKDVDEAHVVDKIIIIHSKKVSQEDISIIQQYGSVIRFNDSLINVPLDNIKASYILADADNRVHLENIERHYENPRFKFVHFGYFFEDYHFSDINTIHKFRVFKDKNDFDHYLLNKKQLERPNKVFSCLSFLVHWVESLKH